MEEDSLLDRFHANSTESAPKETQKNLSNSSILQSEKLYLYRRFMASVESDTPRKKDLLIR